MACTGQDAEADNEPPQQVPPLPGDDSLEVGETSEEGAPPSAKRPRMSEEERGLEQVVKPVKMHGETPAQACLLQEDVAPPAQGGVSAAACVKEEEEVPVSGGGDEECHQNGDGGHGAPYEEEAETKPEEEHNGNRSADSPSEGQQ